MNNTELLKNIKKEYSQMLKRDEMIKKLATLDMSKFEGKALTKRILTYINEKLKNYSTSFYEVGSLKNIEVITKPINYNYKDMIKISITFYQGDAFTQEQYNKELNNWLNSSQNTLKALKSDINHINKRIKDYNKIIDLVEKFEEESSYSFRDNVSYKYSYNHKILIEPKKEDIDYNTTLLLLNMDNIKENYDFIHENIDFLLSQEYNALLKLQLKRNIILYENENINFNIINMDEIRKHLQNIKEE